MYILAIYVVFTAKISLRVTRMGTYDYNKRVY